MSTNETANCSVYRGKCDALKDINNAGLDISLLVQESPAAFDGEPPRRFLPVRAQLTWFRKAHPAGNILTEIVQQTEFAAIVKASVVADGTAVATAHGSADATNDGVYGFKLIETAESRAIARALDFAGYGCQLDLKTIGDESGEPAPAVPDAPAAGEVRFPKEAQDAPPAPIPGTIKGTRRVNANAATGIVDVSTLNGGEPAASQPPSKAKANKRNSGGEHAPAAPAPDAAPEGGAAKEEPTPAEAPASEPAAPAVTDEAAPPESEPASVGEMPAPAAPEDGSEPAAPAADAAPESEPAVPEAADEAPGADAIPDNGSAAPANAEETGPVYEPLTADNIVRGAVTGQIATGEEPELDPAYFTADELADGVVRNKNGMTTAMGTKELQFAVKYLEDKPDLTRSLVYPSNRGALVGLTFGEILKMDTGAMAIESCVKLYQKDNYPAYAAALILNRENKADTK